MGKVMRFVREILDDEASKPGTAAVPVVRGVILHAKRVYADKPEDPIIYLIESLVDGYTYFDVCILMVRTWIPKDGDHVAFQPCDLPIFVYASPIEIDNVAEQEEKVEDEEEIITVPKSLHVLGA